MKFNVNVDVNDKVFSNDKIDEEVLYLMSDMKVALEFKDWILKLSIERKPRYFFREKSKITHDMIENKFALVEEREPQTNMFYKEYIFDFNNLAEVKNNFHYLKELSFDLVNGKKAYPGDFEGILYASEFSEKNKDELRQLIDAKEFPSNIKVYKDLESIWKAANGFYIFRKDFRILPYGAKEWLGFTKKSQTVKAIIYKEHTISGYVNLDGKTSENLVEQTNRQGFVEDEYGRNFLRLLQDVIVNVLAREDANFREGFTINIKKNETEKFLYTKNKLLKFERIIDDEEKRDSAFKDMQYTVNKTEQKTNYSINEEMKTILLNYFKDTQEIERILNSSDETIKSLISAILDALNKGVEANKLINELANKVNELKKLDENIKYKTQQTIYIKNKQLDEYRVY